LPTLAGHLTLPSGLALGWCFNLPVLQAFRGFELLTGLLQDAFDNSVIGFGSTISIAGDADVERRVTRDIASFGRQLGWLQEAILEMSGDASHAGAVRRVAALHAEIEQVKDAG
jgi:hypothetical protein